ncbi:hypothetical protein Plhal304r1_c030g0098791 [Plasmopara halstedii]
MVDIFSFRPIQLCPTYFHISAHHLTPIFSSCSRFLHEPASLHDDGAVRPQQMI